MCALAVLEAVSIANYTPHFNAWCTVHDEHMDSTRSSNLHAQFSFLRLVSAQKRTIFRKCSYTKVSFHLTTTIQLDASWLQYISISWRWPFHELKPVGGKRIAHVSWKILWNSYVEELVELSHQRHRIAQRFFLSTPGARNKDFFQF